MFYRIANRREILGAIAATSAATLLPRIVSAASGNIDHVRGLLDEYVAKKKVAGVVAVIGTHKRPRFVSSGHIAFSDGAAAAGPDLLWRIYSMTKLVTGAAAMLLIEDGKLALDTPIAEIFPTFGSPKVLIDSGTSQTRPAKSAITVRHLMTHTSGLVGSMVPEPPLSTLYADRKLNVSRVSLEDDLKGPASNQSSCLRGGGGNCTASVRSRDPVELQHIERRSWRSDRKGVRHAFRAFPRIEDFPSAGND